MIQYKKGYLNTQADALSHLRTLNEVVALVVSDVLCIRLQNQTCYYEICMIDVLDDKTEVLNSVLVAIEPSTPPSLVLITMGKLI